MLYLAEVVKFGVRYPAAHCSPSNKNQFRKIICLDLIGTASCEKKITSGLIHGVCVLCVVSELHKPLGFWRCKGQCEVRVLGQHVRFVFLLQLRMYLRRCARDAESWGLNHTTRSLAKALHGAPTAILKEQVLTTGFTHFESEWDVVVSCRVCVYIASSVYALCYWRSYECELEVT